jgi:hypothetical protein
VSGLWARCWKENRASGGEACSRAASPFAVSAASLFSQDPQSCQLHL